jgi:mannose-6-phosphate isomerase class I
MILRLSNPIRDYAWGSHEAIANFLGRPAPTPKPQAELWIGAHADDSSIVEVDGGATPLVWLLAEDPENLLGKAVVKRFGTQLPYLMKVLAAASPLSLQAHPTIEQARAGYDDEERRGIPHQANNRNYRDRNHKPELLYALTPFEALCGFRPVADVLASMQRLATPELELLAYGAIPRQRPSKPWSNTCWWRHPVGIRSSWRARSAPRSASSALAIRKPITCAGSSSSVVSTPATSASSQRYS